MAGLVVLAGAGLVAAGFFMDWWGGGLAADEATRAPAVFPEDFYLGAAEAPAGLTPIDDEELLSEIGMETNPGPMDAAALNEGSSAAPPLEAVGGMYEDADETIYMASAALRFSTPAAAHTWLVSDGGCPAGFSAAFVDGERIALLAVFEEDPGLEAARVFRLARDALAEATGQEDACQELFMEGSKDAVPLASGRTGPFSVARDEPNWHTFTLASPATVFIAAMSGTGDMELMLFDEDGVQVAYNDDYNGLSSGIEQRLSAGTYLVRVNELHGERVEYEMWLDRLGREPEYWP